MKSKLFIFVFVISAFSLFGCSKTEKISYVFSDGQISVEENNIYNKNNNGIIEVISVPEFNSAPLCSLPNCTHSDIECISKRFNSVPLICNSKAYYFINDSIEFIVENNITDIKLGTTLYEYNFTSNKERKIKHIDGVVFSENGYIINNNILYFIGNHLGRQYDESGNLISNRNSGGKQQLFSVNLENYDIINLGDMYNPDELTAVYPLAENSAEVYIKGVFDNKIFFDTAFAVEENEIVKFKLYSSYYDLSSEKFEVISNLNNIIFSEINYISKDYLALSCENELKIYHKTYDTPIVIEDEIISVGHHSKCYIDDDLVIYNGYIFDWNSCNKKESEQLKDKKIIMKYENNFITLMKNEFDIIPWNTN